MQFFISFATQFALMVSGTLLIAYVLHVRLRNQRFTRWSGLACIVGLVVLWAGLVVVTLPQDTDWTQRAGVLLALAGAVIASGLWLHQVMHLMFRRRHYDIECLHFHPAATRKL